MTLKFKEKEAKTITFTVKDSDGNTVDVSGASFTFVIKETADGTALVEKTTGFGGSQSDGEVTIDLSADDLNMKGNYIGELKVDGGSSNIDKSETFDVYIKDALTD
jgi:hypothetical protein